MRGFTTEANDEYIIVNWNINSWFSDINPEYLEFKSNVLNISILHSLSLFDHQTISIDNNKVFQQNRKVYTVYTGLIQMGFLV